MRESQIDHKKINKQGSFRRRVPKIKEHIQKILRSGEGGGGGTADATFSLVVEERVQRWETAITAVAVT